MSLLDILKAEDSASFRFVYNEYLEELEARKMAQMHEQNFLALLRMGKPADERSAKIRDAILAKAASRG